MTVTAKIKGKEVTFKLHLDHFGRPAIVATHIGGRTSHCGHLLSISEKGQVVRESGVSTEFGFKLNDEAQIKVVKKGI